MLQTIVLTVFLVINCASGLDCNQIAYPMKFNCLPSSYNGISVISPATSDCALFQQYSIFTECSSTVILGDGVMVPSPPDLNSEDYLRHFVAWQNGIEWPYINFELSSSSGVTNEIAAIELSFLNSPANGISLPDIELYRVQYGLSPQTDIVASIESLLLDNEDLSQTDNEIRRVTVQPLIPLQNMNLRIAFKFTEFHEFDWILLNEVRFCTDEQQNFVPNIQLLIPPSTIVKPGPDDLRGGSTELVCTVSSQGSYIWQWAKDNSVIGNGDPNYDITIGDGTRTTKLVISNLDFSDAGQYKCTAALQYFNSTSALAQIVKFPEMVSIIPVSQTSSEATLECELYGYQSSFSRPLWLNINESRITTFDKYTISSRHGGNTIVLEDGTTLPSVVVSLTIHSLTSADEGDYMCRGTRGESVIRLTLTQDEDDNFPTTILYIATVVAILSVLLMITIILLALVIVFQLKKKKKSTVVNCETAPSITYETATNFNEPPNDYESISGAVSRPTLPRRQQQFSSVGRHSPPQHQLPVVEVTNVDSDDARSSQRKPDDYLVPVCSRSPSLVDIASAVENGTEWELRHSLDTLTASGEVNERISTNDVTTHNECGYDRLKFEGHHQQRKEFGHKNISLAGTENTIAANSSEQMRSSKSSGYSLLVSTGDRQPQEWYSDRLNSVTNQEIKRSNSSSSFHLGSTDKKQSDYFGPNQGIKRSNSSSSFLLRSNDDRQLDLNSFPNQAIKRGNSGDSFLLVSTQKFHKSTQGSQSSMGFRVSEHSMEWKRSSNCNNSQESFV